MNVPPSPVVGPIENLFPWLLWNLLLAVVPVVLGILAGALGRALRRGASRWLWVPFVPMVLLWLLFLPNTCYLFTTPRHFLVWIDVNNAWLRWNTFPDALPVMTRAAAVTAFNFAAGALTLALAIRPVRDLVKLGAATYLLLPLFFISLAAGTYLGLVVRLNSWDALTDPGQVVAAIAALLDKPRRVAAVLSAAAFFWVLYEVVAMALEGFAMRWFRWTEPPVEP